MELKRLYRDFKENLIKNLSFILLIALSSMVIVGFNCSMDSYINGTKEFYKTYEIESGCFTIEEELSQKEIKKLQKQFNIQIEKVKSRDEDLNKDDKEQAEKTVRVMSAERNIDKLIILEGKAPEESNEVVLDSKFGQQNGYSIGSSITLFELPFTIVGYGISPEYVYTLKNTNDLMNSPLTFGVAYVNEKGFKRIEPSSEVIHTYRYKNTTEEDYSTELRKYLDKHYTLMELLKEEDNSRTETIFDDANAPKQLAMLIGQLLLIIVAFIIVISIGNDLKKQSQTIGILYGQGFLRHELLRYYILLPILISTVGTVIGYFVGMKMADPLLNLQAEQYTTPNYAIKHESYLIFLGVILPIMITTVISLYYITKALNKTPLSLLRGDHSEKKVSKLEQKMQFNFMNFFARFRLKQITREKGSLFALFTGVMLSVIILGTAMYMKDSIYNYIDKIQNNLPYEYMYTVTNRDDFNKYARLGEKGVIKDVKIFVNNKERNLVVQGIPDGSQIFKTDEVKGLGEGEVVATPSLLKKYGLQVGNELELKDSIEDKTYKVKIIGISSYDYGLYLYSDVTCFNQIFNLHKQSYNTIFSSQALDIPKDKVSSSSSRQEMIEGINQVMLMLTIISNIMIVVAIIILILVIYMLLSMIMQKSTVNISMVKIFGYQPGEIDKLYLKGYYGILIVAFLLAIPCSKQVTGNCYNEILADMQQYIEPTVTLKSLAAAFCIMTGGYFTAAALLKRKIMNIPLTEALKNRE